MDKVRIRRNLGAISSPIMFAGALTSGNPWIITGFIASLCLLFNEEIKKKIKGHL